MPRPNEQQTELVLENRQVVAIFFGLALLCGIFFALGYVVGRNTVSGPAAPAETATVVPEASEKPSAMPAPSYMPRSPQAAAQTPAEPSATDLNFYDSVQREQPPGILEPVPAGGPEAAQAAQADLPPVGPMPPGIVVQVSALTRREDAESLVSLLREKNLPVLVTTGPNDPLFHVIVGPYKTEAEAQRSKQLLEQDGFRPFIRR